MQITLELIATMIAAILAILGGLAFAVTLVVQVIKNLGPLKDFPTNAVVFGLSILAACIVYPLYFQTLELGMLWYMWVAVVFLGFCIAFVATKGWKAFIDLWNQFKYKKDENVS